MKKKLFIATVLGNILEHYDKVLYAFIAPFIAPLFFPNLNPITALILAYLSFGALSRPLGALFFGYVEAKRSRKWVLYVSIIGMSITMLLIGVLPTYKTIGVFAPLLLYLLRSLVAFFAAGESTSAALILIESSPKGKKEMISSLYESSAILGPFIASVIVSYLCYTNQVIQYWRWLFIISGLLGLIGFLIRRKTFLTKDLPIEPTIKVPLKELIVPFLAIILMTGFSCANYRINLTMMNGYLPLVSSLSKLQMLSLHSALILLDFFLLPLFGYFAKIFGKEKMMFYALLITLLSALPLYGLLNQPTFYKVLIIRLAFTLLGIAIAAPFEYWAIDLVPKAHRFRVISLAKAIGNKFIGGPSIAISLWLYQVTKYKGVAGYYIFSSALLAISMLIVLAYKKSNTSKQKVAKHKLAPGIQA